VTDQLFPRGQGDPDAYGIDGSGRFPGDAGLPGCRPVLLLQLDEQQRHPARLDAGDESPAPF